MSSTVDKYTWMAPIIWPGQSPRRWQIQSELLVRSTGQLPFSRSGGGWSVYGFDLNRCKTDTSRYSSIKAIFLFCLVFTIAAVTSILVQILVCVQYTVASIPLRVCICPGDLLILWRNANVNNIDFGVKWDFPIHSVEPFPFPRVRNLISNLSTILKDLHKLCLVLNVILTQLSTIT